jgi:hypothetical protein
LDVSPRSWEPASTQEHDAPELVVERVSVEPTSGESVDGAGPTVIDLSAQPRPEVGAGIDIRWTDDGACVVELRGRPTRPMLAKARDLLWSRSPQDRLTVVVSDAVLTRELFAMLIAGRRRLSAAGVFEIVGLDAPGARSIANSLRPPPR